MLPRWIEPEFPLPPGMETKAKTLTIGGLVIWVCSEEVPNAGELWRYECYFHSMCVGTSGLIYQAPEVAKREAIRNMRLWSISTVNSLTEAHSQLDEMLEKDKVN